MSKGKYIVIEGLEGTGKGTQVELLRKRIEKLGKEVLFVREPGGTQIGEEIRKIVKSPDLDRVPETEILLFSAARVELARTQVLPALEKGINVVSDRSFLSTIVYQTYGHNRKDLLPMVENVTKYALSGIHPDLIIILDIDPQTGLERAKTKNAGIQDRFDDLAVPFHERVRKGYLEIAKKNKYPVIDASQSISEVEKEIWKIISPIIG